MVTGGVIGLAMAVASAAQTPATSSQTPGVQSGGAQTESRPPVQMFSAILVDPQSFAEQRSVIVRVKVDGLRLVDPYETQGEPKSSEAHLHYRVDQGAIIATTATQISFHELGSGDHVITVQ